MNVSARLILLLTLTISAVMSAAAWFTVRQRAVALEAAARSEVLAHAQTLQIAIEEDFSSERIDDARRLVTRMRENTGLYGVFLFDSKGRLNISSNDSAPRELQYVEEAKQSFATGRTIPVARELNGVEIYSIIMPLKKAGKPIGAIEVAAPIAFVKEDIAKMRRSIILIAMLIGLTILLVVLPVTHYGLSEPVQSLLKGALAIERGQLDYRVTIPRGGGEFATLAREFNRMADSLDDQRKRLHEESEERLALERKLQHTENLAMVGRLAAGVAHEMGAPLQVIDGRAKQLLNHPDAPLEQRQRYLILIRTQSERITRIVRQLLNLSRPYNLNLQQIDLSKAIYGAIELLELNAERAGIEIKVQGLNDITLQADPDLLHQVFLNIFQNAIQSMAQEETDGKETGRPGKLTIETARQAASERDAGMAVVRIMDTGRGIPQEALSKIFDPFFTTKEIGQGTGLGLAISNRFVEEHGGWIEAANNDFGGATFTVFLPINGQPVRSEIRAAAG